MIQIILYSVHSISPFNSGSNCLEGLKHQKYNTIVNDNLVSRIKSSGKAKYTVYMARQHHMPQQHKQKGAKVPKTHTNKASQKKTANQDAQPHAPVRLTTCFSAASSPPLILWLPIVLLISVIHLIAILTFVAVVAAL